MKKVIIIGGGIAGLTAGIYARLNGFETIIFEQHSTAGGSCTGWKRDGYFFEGGLHWLSGSSKKAPLHKVWKEVGALDDSTPIWVRDPFLTCIYEGREVCLYRDCEKLRRHLTEVSPEDEKEINALCNAIRQLSKIAMPVQNAKGVKIRNGKGGLPLSYMIQMIAAMPKLMKYLRMTNAEYALKFKHAALRALITEANGSDYNAATMLLTLGYLASGDGGYPEGGSVIIARNMASRFTGLGGEIKYNSPVERVLTESGKAMGVLAAGQKYDSDAVIVTADTITAAAKLFAEPLEEPWIVNMRENTRYVTCTFIAIGAEADLSDLPENMLFPLSEPITVAGRAFCVFSVSNYAAFPEYAPKGCTALTAYFVDDCYDYWLAKWRSGGYEAEKELVADTVIRLLAEKIPRISGKVAVTDVATPLTYERYSGTSHGSWMTLMGKGELTSGYPAKVKDIAGLYFAGQRIQPPGGMPIALMTGRAAVQHLCADSGRVFEGA